MKTIKISILEFDYHPEVLRNTLRILSRLDLNINVYTRTDIWSKVKMPVEKLPLNTHVFLFDDKKSGFQNFLRNNLEEMNNSDLILINTIASHFKVFNQLHLQPKVILRIHNANAFFNTFPKTYQVKLTPFFIWKDFSHLIRNTIFKLDWIYRKKFLKKVDYFAFPNKTIMDFALQHFPLREEQCMAWPFSYLSQGLNPKNNNHSEITISIIGKIDQRNRDYITVFKAFKKLSANIKNDDFSIKLILLGSAKTRYGSKIIKLFSKIASPQLEIISFNSFVEQDDFNRYIQETDFIILPIQIKTRYTIYTEFYGSTKISGGLNDILVHKKPALINAAYPLEADFEQVTDRFNDEIELSDKIYKWCRDKAFDQKDIDSALANHSLTQVRAIYRKTIQSITKGN